MSVSALILSEPQPSDMPAPEPHLPIMFLVVHPAPSRCFVSRVFGGEGAPKTLGMDIQYIHTDLNEYDSPKITLLQKTSIFWKIFACGAVSHYFPSTSGSKNAILTYKVQNIRPGYFSGATRKIVKNFRRKIKFPFNRDIRSYVFVYFCIVY